MTWAGVIWDVMAVTIIERRIDAPAKGGMKFTDGYAACNVCSPTRSHSERKISARLLLTQWLPSGRWSPQKNWMRGVIFGIPLEEVTIAGAMREAGYRTAFMEKWHLVPRPIIIQSIRVLI